MHRLDLSDADDLMDANLLHKLTKAAEQVGHMLRTTHSGYLLHTATVPLIHLIDLEQVADTLERLKREVKKAIPCAVTI